MLSILGQCQNLYWEIYFFISFSLVPENLTSALIEIFQKMVITGRISEPNALSTNFAQWDFQYEDLSKL